MHNYYDLSFPCEVLRKDADFSAYPEFKNFHWAVWNDRSEKYLTPECLDFIKTMGITDQVWFDNQIQRDHVTVFRGNKGQFMDIHCDRGPTWCINLAWGVSSSDMVWYAPHANTRTDAEMCSVGSEYQRYDPRHCDEIERTSSHGPVLVRIDTPHNVINHDKDNFRWCVSIRDLSNKWTWEQAVEHFKPWVKSNDH